MLHKHTSPHQTHKKAPPLQRPKPHHLMKCEKGTWRSHVPFSHFGGRGGTSSPHKKTTRGRLVINSLEGARLDPFILQADHASHH